jgi:Uma2 family endonuclease
MDAIPAKTRYTYNDYCQLPDEKRYEVIGGELFVVPSPSVVHQKVIRNLLFLFMKHIEKTGSGFVFSAPLDVLLSEDNVVQPDIIYISDENSRIIGEANISGVPDLIVEVLSPSTAQLDHGKKKELYARYGVKELWIVHPVLQTVEVFINLGASFGEPNRCDRRTKKPLNTAVLPGLSLSLDEVF